MRIDLGLILAIVLEYIFFICYAETSFYKKRNTAFCIVAIAAGYTAHFFICIFGNIIANTLSFFLLNAAALWYCYHVSMKTAVSESAILTVISIAGELSIAAISGIALDDTLSINAAQSFMLTITSKLVYLTGIIVLTHVFRQNRKSADASSVYTVIVPILTLIILILMMKTPVDGFLQIAICVILAVIDLIILLLNRIIIGQYLENKALKLYASRDEGNLCEYERLSILYHDIKEHIDTVVSLIGDDNKEARDYLRSIYPQAVYKINYTDNKILNIILSKKIEECNKLGIEFILDPVQASLRFFRDKDTVAIFANLINNAMESCKSSTEKKICMNIYTVNENFTAIKIENSCDEKPLVIDGRLKTHKDNERLHGRGINSIKMALEPYNGTFLWGYDEERRIFRATVTINTSAL